MKNGTQYFFVLSAVIYQFMRQAPATDENHKPGNPCFQGFPGFCIGNCVPVGQSAILRAGCPCPVHAAEQNIEYLIVRHNMYFEDLKTGMTRDIAPVVIEQSKMTAFAQQYDPIPLHLDEAYAKASPFGALIAPGVMSFMSVWAKYLEDDFAGREVLAGKSTKIEWVKPVYAGDVLTGKAEITRCEKRNNKNGLIEITIHVNNQNGDLVLTNVTEAVVKCRAAETLQKTGNP